MEPKSLSCHNVEETQLFGAFPTLHDKAHYKTAADAPQRQLQAQKLQTIGMMASEIAHDFNNQLTVIASHVELLASQFPTDKGPQSLHDIRTAITQGATLTAQLLAYSRQQAIDPQMINLKTAVYNLANLLRPLLRKQIQLQIHLDPLLGAIKAIPGQLEQVIVNLALNARDAMPHGGSFSLESYNLDISPTFPGPPLPGPYVVLKAADTGCGMDDLTRSRLFQPFFTTKPNGTGMGLTSVYRIVSDNHGHIDIHSAPGRGATFTIFWPRWQDNPASRGP